MRKFEIKFKRRLPSFGVFIQIHDLWFLQCFWNKPSVIFSLLAFGIWIKFSITFHANKVCKILLLAGNCLKIVLMFGRPIQFLCNSMILVSKKIKIDAIFNELLNKFICQLYSFPLFLNDDQLHIKFYLHNLSNPPSSPLSSQPS